MAKGNVKRDGKGKVPATKRSYGIDKERQCPPRQKEIRRRARKSRVRFGKGSARKGFAREGVLRCESLEDRPEVMVEDCAFRTDQAYFSEIGASAKPAVYTQHPLSHVTCAPRTPSHMSLVHPKGKSHVGSGQPVPAVTCQMCNPARCHNRNPQYPQLHATCAHSGSCHLQYERPAPAVT
jgi:hypothetical protein